MNSLSLFGAISGIIFLIMDIFNITISHFFKWEGLKDDKPSEPYVNIYNCESANPAERNTLSIQYCKSIRSVFLVSGKSGFFSGRRYGIFIMIINSGSRLSASATCCLYGFGREF